MVINSTPRRNQIRTAKGPIIDADAGIGSPNPAGGGLPGGPQVGGPPGIGGLPEYANYGDNDYKIPGAELPSLDKRNQVQGGFNKNLGAAKDYLGNFNATSDRLYQGYENAARSSLAKGMKGVKQDFNSRGLLGSGMQADKSAQLTNSVNSDLLTKRSDINRGLLGNLNQMEGNAFTLGNEVARGGPDTANPYLSGVGSQLALESGSQEMMGQMYGDISQGIGALGGYGLANLMRKTRSNNYDA